MMRQLRRLREVGLTRTGFGVVIAGSLLATVLVIATALGRTAAQTQALALLRHPRVERVVLPRRPAASAPVASSDAAPSSDAAASTSTASPSSTTTTTAATTENTVTSTSTTTTPASTPVPSKVKHVFVIALTTPSYRAAFGTDSTMHYLDHALRPKGDLLSAYETLGETALPDYLAMISGQAPNRDTERDCTTYAEFPASAAPNKAGEVPGRGCVYPSTILTIGDQLDAAATGWKGYFEDMGSALPTDQQSCQHPNSNAVDTTTAPVTATTPGGDTTTPVTATTPGGDTTTTVTTTTPGGDAATTPGGDTATVTTTTPAGGDTTATVTTTTPAGGDTTTTVTTTTPAPVTEDDYATSQNPFVYFHSLLDLGDCQSDDLPLTKLTSGLRSAPRTPNLVYIAPGLCDDGSDTPCPGVTPSGSAGADAFLKRWARVVLSSPAYRKNGVLIIVFAPSRTKLPAHASRDRPIRTGALVISRYAKAGSTSSAQYTPYSVLRSIEDLFALTPLAHAKSATSFATSALPGAWAKAG